MYHQKWDYRKNNNKKKQNVFPWKFQKTLKGVCHFIVKRM